MKKAYIKIVLAMVFLLTVFSAMGSIVQAASTETYTVTIEYNANACTVVVTVDGRTLAPTEINGNTYLVPKNHLSFQIAVNPLVGYSLSPLTDKDTDQAFAPVEEGVFQPSLTKDMNYMIRESAKVYTIQEMSAEGLAHVLKFTSMQYTYSSTETVTLPIPELDGYAFMGWVISDASGRSFEMNATDNNEIIFSTSNHPASGDVFYATPKWKGLPQQVTRFDYEFDPSGTSTIPVNNGISGVVNTTTWYELNGTTNINGKDGGNEADGVADGAYKKYAGYYDFADYCTEQYYTNLQKVKTDISANKMYRYYVPITYTVVYENVDDDSIYPKTHVYNVATPIKDYANPERTGYNFAGWKVYITKNGVKTDVTASLGGNDISAYKSLTLSARELCLAEGNDDNKIILEATWTPKTYTVSYDWNGADENALIFTKPTQYVYDTDLVIVDPIRTGYTFLGWQLTSGAVDTTIDSVEGKTTLVAKTYTDDITLKALWRANEYTVTFDENLAEQKGTESMKVTFDSLPDLSGLLLPKKEGHKLLGFTLTKDGTDFIIDVDSATNTATFLRSVWDIPADTTLYAKWDVIAYDLTVNCEHAQVWINGELYTGTVSIDYGTAVTVKVVTEAGYKLTAWNGTAIAHVKEYEYSFTMGAAATEITSRVLPTITVPTLTVDYVSETFVIENATAGTYQIVGNGTTLLIRIDGTDLYVNGVKLEKITIPNEFFGATISYTVFGDGTTNADSDPVQISLAERPEKPLYNDHISGTTADTDSVGINLNLNAGYTYEYEFALSLNSEGTSMLIDWMTPDGVKIVMNADGSVDFKGLNPGTDYYIFIRVKAVAGQAPHGEEQFFKQSTAYEDYFNQILADLENMKTGGEMVDQLIEEAKDEIKALKKPSATFYESLMSIYNRVTVTLPFAQAQDERIIELIALRNELVATKEYSEAAIQRMNALCEETVRQICDATSQDEIQSFFNAAVAELNAIKITYLFYGNMNLTSQAGLLQGSKLFWGEQADTDALIQAINAAIQSGKVSVAVGNNMTLAEAADLLRELEVMGCYTLRITNGTTVLSTFNGMYEMRWLIPESLRNVSGLQIACYNEKTGVLEILSTTRDGDYLVFTADHVSDFVVLGDPTVVLTGFIAALGAILLCQLIAIALLLARRMKNKNARSYSLMLPALLTVHFLPANGLTIVVVLGALVVLAQIILLYLLLSSDVIARRKQRNRAADPAPVENENGADAVVTEESAENFEDVTYSEELAAAQAIFAEDAESLSEAEESVEETEESILEEEAEEASYEEAEELSYEETDYEEAEEASYEDSEESADEAFYEEDIVEEILEEDAEELIEEPLEADEAISEEDGYESFIEPAADPRYSLPDEEFAEEATEVEAEEALEQETEAAEAYEEGTTWEYDEDASAEPEEAESDSEWQEKEAPADDQAIEWTEESAQPATEWAYDDEAEAAEETVEEFFQETEEDAEAESLAAEETAEETEAPAEETEEPIEEAAEDAAEEAAEDAAEETEEEPAEPKDEFYIEPDAQGDPAPAPDYSIYSNEEEPKQYDGYEE